MGVSFELRKQPQDRWTMVDCQSVTLEKTNRSRMWRMNVNGSAYQPLSDAGVPTHGLIRLPLQDIANTVASVMNCSPKLRRLDSGYDVGNTGFELIRCNSNTRWELRRTAGFPDMTMARANVRRERHQPYHEVTIFRTRKSAVELLQTWYREERASVAQVTRR